jgi:hypothetical protein
MPVWQPIRAEGSGYFLALSEAIAAVESNFPAMLTPMPGSSLSVFSDYSGQHKGARHEAYSYLVAAESDIQAWLPLRAAWRDRYLPDGRRLSFKKLGESTRKRALPSFLDLCSRLRGNVVTFLIDNRIGRFANFDLKEIFPDCFDGPESEFTTEKMFRVAGLTSLLLAGLKHENQQLNWISDQDEALETTDRREGLARLMAYLTFGFTGWRQPATVQFGTTGSQYALEWYEDLSAIPDIFAGAYCQLAGLLPSRFKDQPVKILRSNEVSDYDGRAVLVGNWLASNNGELRHTLARLELDENQEVSATAQFIAGFRA